MKRRPGVYKHTAHLTARLPKGLVAQVKQLAVEQRRSANSVIRLALEAYLVRKGQVEP